MGQNRLPMSRGFAKKNTLLTSIYINSDAAIIVELASNSVKIPFTGYQFPMRNMEIKLMFFTIYYTNLCHISRVHHLLIIIGTKKSAIPRNLPENALM